ncbi:MAG: FlgD immunoglobulin-like domain containing protein, partial [Candidatus Krumholzibacteria bacterium]
GSSWVSQTSGTTNWLWGVSFTDATTGTAVGDRGTILRTTASIGTGFLPSFQSYWTGSHVEVSWRLIDIEGELTFNVSRRSGSSERYARVHDPEIIRNGDEFVFVDRSTEPATRYYYLVTIKEDGSVVSSFETATTTPLLKFALGQNHPNPFNPATRIDFAVDQKGPVHLAIYDISGKLVRTLINRRMRSGPHSEEWDGRDNGGRAVASGIYFYRLTAGKKSLARKAVLLK